jgi:hypothetical protein
VPREIDHAELLDAALRERAEQRLLWLRDPTRPQQPGDAYKRLFSPEGWESLEQAVRERRYGDAELTQLPDMLADLARERARLAGRGWLGVFLHKPLAIGSTQRVPAAALSPLFEPVQTVQSPSGPSEALRALGAALESDVMRFIELRERAEYDAETLRDKLARLLPKPERRDAPAPHAPGSAQHEALARLMPSPEQREAFEALSRNEQREALARLMSSSQQREALAQLIESADQAAIVTGAQPSAALAQLSSNAEQAEARARQIAGGPESEALAARRVLFAPAETAEAPAAPTASELAETWLERTDDAWQELTRWLIKHSELPSTENNLARILVGLRAFDLDGLARSDRRFFRLAVGARKLGFERDMTARMRGENTPALLLPLPLCVPISAPRDVRVLQPDLEYGVLSDLSIAQGIGEGLALALISPAVGPLLSRPQGASVSAAMGGLFAQLRADSVYLRRVDGFERDAAEKAARIAALWLLLRARMNAALALTWRASARSSEERLQQLAAAGQRALGHPVPRGMLAMTLLAQESSEQQFAGLHWGFELHALLRERLDQDFYLNPRLSEVLRGAATRGAGLDAPGLAAELSTRSRGASALDRLFELLG